MPQPVLMPLVNVSGNASVPTRTGFARTMVFVAISAVLLVGCQGRLMPTAGDAVSIFCATVQPIRWSTADTDLTIQQARELNAVYVELCR